MKNFLLKVFGLLTLKVEYIPSWLVALFLMIVPVVVVALIVLWLFLRYI